MVVLVPLLAVSAVACVEPSFGSEPGYGEHASAIVGGSEALPGEWPDTVAVLGRKGTCTGTLVAPDVVLTAGHCAGIDPVQVIADTTDYSTDAGVRVHVAHTHVYPSWQTTYDVAVLVLIEPIAGVAPRKIGTSCTFDGFESNLPVRLVGFGAIDTMGRAGNTRLREAVTAVLDPDCTGGNGCKDQVAPGGEFVAGGTGDADSCFGDSGGPVLLDTAGGPVVIGAVSRGIANAATPCGAGGIYVRTDKIVAWIEATAGKPIAKDACDDVAYSSETGLDEDELAEASVGCSIGSGGSGSAGAVMIVVLALLRRRRA